MHRMLEAINAGLDDQDHRWGHTVVSRSSTMGGVTRLELIETLEFEERKRVDMEEGGHPIRDRVEQAALVSSLASAVRKFAVEVSAYAVVSTYDPSGSFRPGQKVVWSGHLSQEEAERVLPQWERHLRRSKDSFAVEYRSVEVYRMRKDGWGGPTR